MTLEECMRIYDLTVTKLQHRTTDGGKVALQLMRDEITTQYCGGNYLRFNREYLNYRQNTYKKINSSSKRGNQND